MVAAIIFLKGHNIDFTAAQNDALLGSLILITDNFQKLNFDENVHHDHKNTNFSAMEKRNLYENLNLSSQEIYLLPCKFL